MKKIFLSLLMLAAINTAFAQMTPEEKAAAKAAEKEAKSLVAKGIKLRDEVNVLYKANQDEFAKADKKDQGLIDANIATIKEKSLEANELLMKALQSGAVPEKQLFNAYKALDDVSSQLLNPELSKAAAKETLDTLTFAKSVDGVCEGCYGQLEYGNPKHYEQGPIYTQAVQKMPKLMVYYAYLCIFYIETKNLDGAMAALDKYAAFAKKYPKAAEDELVKNPQYPVSQMAFNIYLTAFNAKRYEICEKYYELASQFNDPESHNFVLSSRPQIYLENGDTLNWVKGMEKIIKETPESANAEIAAQKLLAYYDKKDASLMNAFADQLLEQNPGSKIANYGKGYSLFAKGKFNEAVPYFQKAVEADPDYLEGIYMAGMSLYRQGTENYYKEVDGKKFKTTAEMQAAEENFVKKYYREAATYFEDCRDKASDKPDMWALPLHTIYKNLGEKGKAAEVEPYTK